MNQPTALEAGLSIPRLVSPPRVGWLWDPRTNERRTPSQEQRRKLGLPVAASLRLRPFGGRRSNTPGFYAATGRGSRGRDAKPLGTLFGELRGGLVVFTWLHLRKLPPGGLACRDLCSGRVATRVYFQNFCIVSPFNINVFGVSFPRENARSPLLNEAGGRAPRPLLASGHSRPTSAPGLGGGERLPGRWGPGPAAPGARTSLHLGGRDRVLSPAQSFAARLGPGSSRWLAGTGCWQGHQGECGLCAAGESHEVSLCSCV